MLRFFHRCSAGGTWPVREDQYAFDKPYHMNRAPNAIATLAAPRTKTDPSAEGKPTNNTIHRRIPPRITPPRPSTPNRIALPRPGNMGPGTAMDDEILVRREDGVAFPRRPEVIT